MPVVHHGRSSTESMAIILHSDAGLQVVYRQHEQMHHITLSAVNPTYASFGVAVESMTVSS